VDGVWWRLEGVTHESSSRPGPSVAGKGALVARVRGVPPPRCDFCTNPDSCGFGKMWMKIKKSKLASSIMAGDGDVYTWIVTLSKQA
jgi:hypothetical protein